VVVVVVAVVVLGWTAFTKEWYIARSARDSLRMHHPVVDGTTRYDMCDFELVIQRSFLVFFVKSMVAWLDLT
jgi:hypothetical protein